MADLINTLAGAADHGGGSGATTVEPKKAKSIIKSEPVSSGGAKFGGFRKIFEWGSPSSGGHTCLPAVDEAFSDVAGAAFESGSGVSERECEWFNVVADAGLRAAKDESSCVPNDAVFATLVNAHFWDMLVFNLQNVVGGGCKRNSFDPWLLN